jgi:hypothetical protein
MGASVAGFIRKLWLIFAARPYAAKLPRALRKGWGGSTFYTPGQIRAAVRTLRLNPRLIAFGFATFLPEGEYESLAAETPVKLPYLEARGAVLAWYGAKISDSWNPSDGSGVIYDGVYDPGGHHAGEGGAHH